jgi:hypothetical protein
MKRVVAALFVIITACNTSSDLRRWYVQTDSARRAATIPEQVQVLEADPSNSSYKVIGLFSPPNNAFASYGEALKGAQRAAALYGADAIIVTSHSETQQVRRNAFESATLVHIEVKAIVFSAR